MKSADRDAELVSIGWHGARTAPQVRVARCAIALLFLVAGAQKLLSPEHMAPLLRPMGMSSTWALAIGAFELIGGLAFVAGFRLRWVAAALGIWAILTAVVGHPFWKDPEQVPGFLKNVGLAGAFLLFVFPSDDPAARDGIL